VTGRLLAALAILLVAAARPGSASAGEGAHAAYDRELRQLDREEFLEDEPIWLCASDLPVPADPDHLAPRAWKLVAREGRGRTIPPALGPTSNSDPVDAAGHEVVPRGIEFTLSLGLVPPSSRFPILGAGGLPEGLWEIRPVSGAEGRPLARIRVTAPTGAERSVRDGLARAARLSGAQPARAAALYDAIYRRYPRTTYLSVIYWGEWGVRAHTRFANDPGRWIEEIFAHFHDSCFGVIALDRWVRDMGADAAQPALRRLVGIYPDTPLSRAALRYL